MLNREDAYSVISDANQTALAVALDPAVLRQWLDVVLQVSPGRLQSVIQRGRHRVGETITVSWKCSISASHIFLEMLLSK